MKKIIIQIVLLLFVSIPIFGQSIYNYEEGETSIKLGQSWEPKSPMSSKYLCGFFQSSNVDEAHINATDVFSQSFAENFSEFQKMTKISIDANGKTSVGVFKIQGDASFDQQREFFRSDRKVVWIISGKRTYEPVTLQKIELTEKGKTELKLAQDSHDFTNFIGVTGSHIVTSITKEAEINLIYVFTVSNSSLKENLKTAISLSANGGLSSSGIKTSFIDELKKVDNNLDYQVYTLQKGVADNSPALANIISAAPGDIDEVRKQLDLVVKSFLWQNSMITQFKAEPISSLMNMDYNDRYNYDRLALKVNRIKLLQDQIVTRYLELSDVIKSFSLGNIVSKTGAEDEIKIEMDTLLNHFDLTISSLKSIYINPRQSVPDIKISTGVIKWFVLDFGNFLRWDYETTGNWYDSQAELVKGMTTFWPCFYIKNIYYIKRFEIIKNGITVASFSQKQLQQNCLNDNTNIRAIYSLSFNYCDYCFRGRWGEECNPRKDNKPAFANNLKANENGINYSYRIIDIENNKYEYQFINPSKQVYY